MESEVEKARREAVTRKLATCLPSALPDRKDQTESENPDFNKAAVIPFYRDVEGALHFYWMKPEPGTSKIKPAKQLPDPQWQICKGTRMFQRGEEWIDFKPPAQMPAENEQLETLPQTALREGAEEVGLRMENIERILLWGEDKITSQSSGNDIPLWVALVEVIDPKKFDLPDPNASKTGPRDWIKWGEYSDEITPSHFKVVENIVPKLQQYLQKTAANRKEGLSK